MSFEIPLFPLNVVLFPSMQLPLHIFEPRYRRMVQGCLDGNRAFGVALIISGEEGQTDTVPADIGCMAEIESASEFPDGRFNLVTIGRRRFKIVELREEDELWIGTCEWLEDDEEQGVYVQARLVRRALRRYLQTLTDEAHGPVVLEELNVPLDPYGLSMWIAALITMPNEQKQELLSTTSTGERLDIEHRWLRRGEIVQRAFERQLAQEDSAPASESDDNRDNYAPFISLN